MAMFPDSGVPANQAINSLPNVDTLGCDELWYSTSRCQPRFDPAAANAELAELMNLINKGEVQYDCEKLNNAERAVRYLVQRGFPRGCRLDEGPFDYKANLDPVLTRYNDYLTLTVIPDTTNQSKVTVNIDGQGKTPLLRNDGKELESQDIRANRPEVICYWHGAFYVVGLVQSQVPILSKVGIDGWIRPDGNDNTGDGTANTPDKAFKTIAGAWDALGSRYAATPSFSISLRLGEPGTYEGAALSDFGGKVSLRGDEAHPQNYRIKSYPMTSNVWASLRQKNSSVIYTGLTFLRDANNQDARCIVLEKASADLVSCILKNETSNSEGSMIILSELSHLTYNSSGLIIDGGGMNFGVMMRVSFASTFRGREPAIADIVFKNIDVNTMQQAEYLSTITWTNTRFTVNNCKGKKYIVNTNSIIDMRGQPEPGDSAGVSATGGLFIP